MDIPHQAKRSWQVWKSRDVTKGKDAGLHKHSSPHLPPWLQSWVNQHAALHHLHQTTSSTTPNHKMKYMHHDNLQYLYAHQGRVDLCSWCSALKCISPHLSPPVSGSAAALLCCTIAQLPNCTNPLSNFANSSEQAVHKCFILTSFVCDRSLWLIVNLFMKSWHYRRLNISKAALSLEEEAMGTHLTF